MAKPSVFIGSSTEGLKVARELQFQLRNDARVDLWNEGVLRHLHSYLESLTLALGKYDFAILVLRADDIITSRDTVMPSTRGNVLFELGLFMGRLGRLRTFVVYDTHNRPDVISDLTGIAFFTYDGRDLKDLRAAVAPACHEIRTAIETVWLEPVPPDPNNNDPQFFPTVDDFESSSTWLQLLQNTNKVFNLMGITLNAWRKTDNFKELLMEKARNGCKIRVLFMHKDNPALSGLVFSPAVKDYGGVIPAIDQSVSFFRDCARETKNLRIRQMHHGNPHFFLARSDQTAVILQYLYSDKGGDGPLWQCTKGSKLYSIVEDEFNVLWELNKQTGELE